MDPYKPTRFFIDDPTLPEPEKNRLIGEGKQWLNRMKGLQEAGAVTQVWEKTLNDGTVFRMDTSGDIDNVKIETKRPKKEEKKEEEIIETTYSEWVLLLGIESPSQILGVLVISQDFKVIYFAKNDDPENFDGFGHWNRFYDFKTEWGSEESGGKNTVEEWPRRSEQWLLTADYSHPVDEYYISEWAPGAPPDSEYVTYHFSKQPVYGPNLARTYWNVDGWHTGGYPGTWEDMGNTLYNGNTPGDPVSDWDFTASDTDPYGLEGSGYPIFNLWWWRQGRYHSWGHYEGIISVTDGIEIVEYEEHNGEFPWPYDGKQRKDYRSIDTYSEWWYFEKDGNSGSQIFERTTNYGTVHSSEHDGVWTNTGSTEYQKWQDNDEYQSTEDCVTVTSPEDCLTNDVYEQFGKWMLLAIIQPYTYNISTTISPYCIWSSYWNSHELEIIDWSFTDVYRYEIWFDDGNKIVIETKNHEGDTAQSFDMGIYNDHTKENNPIYAFHYLHATASQSEELVHNLMYYYKGELHISEDFAEEGGQNSIDAFDCVKNYGGYWYGQVRVGLLTTTEKKEAA